MLNLDLGFDSPVLPGPEDASGPSEIVKMSLGLGIYLPLTAPFLITDRHAIHRLSI